MDLPLHFVTLPLQKDTSEWDKKIEESQILLSRLIRGLSTSDKADPMRKEITYPLDRILILYLLVYQNLLESPCHIIS